MNGSLSWSVTLHKAWKGLPRRINGLLDTFISYEGNEELWIQYRVFCLENSDNGTKVLQLLTPEEDITVEVKSSFKTFSKFVFRLFFVFAIESWHVKHIAKLWLNIDLLQAFENTTKILTIQSLYQLFYVTFMVVDYFLLIDKWKLK